MSVSFLIVNWNSKDLLRNCLKTVRETCANLAPQIVVVDSGSFDGCGEMLAAEFSEVEFIQSPDNLGFGLSNNLGFKHVTGEYILLLNPDTELKPQAVEALLTALRERSAAGLVGPRLLNTDGSLQTSCVQSLPTPLNQALDCEFLRKLFPHSRLWGTWVAFSVSEPVEVEAVSGACMLLRSETFRKIGGFRPDFFMYGEDMDLCAKVRRLGLNTYHVPGATVVHHGGGSSYTQVSQFSTVMKRVAGETYMRLNLGPGAVLRYRVLQGLSAVVRLGLLLPATFFLRRERRASANASLQKWLAVLRWVVGASPVRLPLSGALVPSGPVASSTGTPILCPIDRRCPSGPVFFESARE